MKKLLAPLLLFISVGVYAHQDPLYAHYLNNQILLNPAYAGSNQQWQTTAGYRSQWSGFDGNPIMLNFSKSLR